MAVSMHFCNSRLRALAPTKKRIKLVIDNFFDGARPGGGKGCGRTIDAASLGDGVCCRGDIG
jgi:hypothetical protein